MQLEGFLSRFPLQELLELSVASLINGAIEVQTPSGLHRLFFREGELVHAASPEATGLDAVWPLFELNDAPFRFVAGAAARERTISEPTLQVIEQALVLAQQWAKVRPYIASIAIIPELVSPVNGDQVRIFEEDWPILSSVDGTRSIAEVARRASRDPLEVCIGLLRLKERGLVSLTEQRVVTEVRPSRPEAAEVSPPKPVKTAVPKSFFAKLLTGVPEEVLAPPVPVMMPKIEGTVPAAAVTPVSPPVAAPPTEYDDILLLLRS
jgi:hypothetical protein